jgi:hypothetical protein
VVVIDSISPLWDACKNAFTGKLTKAGTVPLHGWIAFKKPCKDLLHRLLASPIHVLICGRQGNDFAEDEGLGELKTVGFTLRAEGENRLRAGRADPDGSAQGEPPFAGTCR